MKDYYQILGISSTASQAEIRRAYRRLAVMYHPDKNRDPNAGPVFQEINEAYQILGEPSTRQAYDTNRQNPFAEILQEEIKPQHRDPAYRRKRPPSQPARPSMRQLMKEYLPYVNWLNWAGMSLLMIMAIDYALPTIQTEESIIETYRVTRGRANSYSHHLVITDTGRKIKLYDFTISFFEDGKIGVEHTPILQQVMRVYNSSGDAMALGGIYGPVLIIPFMLLAVSGMGVLMDRNIEYAFNMGVGSGILIILTVYLLIVL